MGGKDGKNVGRWLILASRLHRVRIGEKLQALGLFPGQEQVLEALAATDGMPMGELAERLSVRPPTVSKTIARLSAQGLVRRAAVGGDGRLVRVEITPEGREKVEAFRHMLAEVEDEMLSDLDGKEARRLRKLLKKVARTLAEAGGRAPANDDEPEEELAEA